MKLPDALLRGVYKLGYPLARLWWWARRPEQHGALLMLWWDENVLLLGTSYHGYWTVPGGGIRRGETPEQAVVREAAEEIGLNLSPSEILLLGEVEHIHMNRCDRCHVFEARLSQRPNLTLDNREIVRALWTRREEALHLPLQPHVRTMLVRDA